MYGGKLDGCVGAPCLERLCPVCLEQAVRSVRWEPVTMRNYTDK